jgi:hypothetical protein
MPVQHEHAAGIDVGDATHWVCLGRLTPLFGSETDRREGRSNGQSPDAPAPEARFTGSTRWAGDDTEGMTFAGPFWGA